MATTHTRKAEAKFELARRKSNKTGEYTPARNNEFRLMSKAQLIEIAGTQKPAVKAVAVQVRVATKGADKLKVKANTAFTKAFAKDGKRAAFRAYKAVMQGAKA